MNAGEIMDALGSHKVTSAIFEGVYPADRIPTNFDCLPSACVINTDPSHLPGQHWIGIYQDESNKIEFFDSFGKSPVFHNLVSPLFVDNVVVQQDCKMQSDISTVCGQYAMFFVYHRCCGKSFREIVNLFSKNAVSNDTMVLRFVNRVFELKTPFLDVDFAL